MELEEQPVKKFEQIAFVTLKTKITRMVYLLLEVLPEVQRCRVIHMPKKGYTCCLTKDIQPADDRTACYVERCLCFDLLNHSKYISRMWCNRNTPALGAGVAVQI